jgi:two-component system nitrogen regulation sensor histidine kinase NtrY
VLQRTAYPQITFTVDLPQEPARLRCDARQLVQALTNVLKNAVEAIEARFGAVGAGKGPGAVLIRLERNDEAIVIRVIDNGTGLPQSARERLTEPYVTTRAKGTGLGLAIVKKILEDHGGDLSLEDAPLEIYGEIRGEERAIDNAKSARVGAQITLRLPMSLAVETTTQMRAVEMHAAQAGE